MPGPPHREKRGRTFKKSTCRGGPMANHPGLSPKAPPRYPDPRCLFPAAGTPIGALARKDLSQLLSCWDCNGNTVVMIALPLSYLFLTGEDSNLCIIILFACPLAYPPSKRRRHRSGPAHVYTPKTGSLKNRPSIITGFQPEDNPILLPHLRFSAVGWGSPALADFP